MRPAATAAAVEVHSAEGADVRREVAGAVVAEGWGLLEMRRARLSLEEIFLQLTTTEEEEAEVEGAPVGTEADADSVESGDSGESGAPGGAGAEVGRPGDPAAP